jgi:geranylgeranyl reductase family protein
MGKSGIHSKVVIAGSGPAGCAAAYALAKESINVTVFEQGQPGKEKVCGDALVPSSTALLSLFGIDQEYIKALGGYYYDRFNLYKNESLIRQSIYKNKSGWVIPRAIIDQEIRNITAKHASFQYDTCVTDLTIESTGSPKLSTILKDGISNQIECDAIILATGSRNRLSKKLGIDGKPRKAFAITMYVEMQQLDTLVFQFLDSYESLYRWIFPLSERVANVGICLFGEKEKVNLRSLGEEFLREYHANPLGKWRGGWGPLWSGLGKCWHHPSGVVSCGDAAGLINPHSGEGITAALESGEQAGKAVLNYLTGNHDPVKLVDYSKWISEYFDQKYKKIALY